MSDGYKRPPGPKYSKVTRAIWQDAKFLALSNTPCAQLLFLRLLTAPELSPMPGLIPVGRAALCEALDWQSVGFDQRFAELEAAGMAVADWKARLVWLPNAIKHNPPENPNVVVAWRRAMAEMPECELREKAAQSVLLYVSRLGGPWYDAWVGRSLPKPPQKPKRKGSTKGIAKGYPKVERKGMPKGYRNHEHEQEQEQRTKLAPVAKVGVFLASDAEEEEERLEKGARGRTVRADGLGYANSNDELPCHVKASEEAWANALGTTTKQ